MDSPIQPRLGNNGKIGGYVGSFLFNRKKILLSYSVKKGLKICKLNLFQLFLRKYFGLFKSTHLNKVFEKSGEIAPEYAIENWYDHINFAWGKKNVKYVGNSKILDANVICFAEEHADRAFQIFTAYLINKMYSEKDIVLAECVEAGKTIDREELFGPNRLRSNICIQGWEPENFEEIQGSAMKTLRKKIREAEQAASCFKQFADLKIFRNESLSELKKKLEDFSKKIISLNQYFNSCDHRILEIKKFTEALFKEAEKNQLTGKAILCTVFNLVMILTKNCEESFQKNVSSEEFSEIKKFVPERNKSLSDRIQILTKSPRKVFVIAGAYHLLKSPSTVVSCKVVRKTLKKNNFVILTRKSILKKSLHKSHAFFNLRP